MQEIKKKKIVIASVLKPVDDTRMFEKIGQSLSATGGFEVHIIGYPTQRVIKTTEPKLYPSKNFRRLSFSRIIQPIRVFSTILQIRPAVLIITSHELLFVATFLKLVTRCAILYDVQENYYRNILYTPAFPFWLRPVLAFYVRTKEIIFAPAIDYFLLAETGYASELKFTKQKHIILQNKLKMPNQTFTKKSEKDKLLHLLFSGTLAETTGVFNAIELAKKLHHVESRIRLTIIGFCPQTNTYHRIKKAIEGFSFINLVGGTALVPHEDIVKEIQQSDFGIIAYPPNRSTENRIPTKLFEYLGCKLPILLVNHKSWTTICASYNAGIVVDFEHPNIPQILHHMHSTAFYNTSHTDVFWENEADTLINLVDLHSKF